MVHSAMTTQLSAQTQNHLWVLNKLITVVQTLQQQGFKLKNILLTHCFVSTFDYNAISIPATLCMIFQHHLHRFTPIFILPGHGCSPEARWRHRAQDSHTQLDNNHAGLHTYWSYKQSAWHARLQSHQLTYLLTCTISGSMAVCWRLQLHYNAIWS